jgi:hypothetical protein
VPELPAHRVLQALLALGFQAVLDDGPFLTYMRIDTDRGVCVITLDVRSPEISQGPLVADLDYYGISLADFWNAYDATADA